MLDFLAKYNKFIVAFVAAIISLVTIYFGSQPWIPVLISFLAAIGVVVVPNKQSGNMLPSEKVQ
jgi:uncharacterized membrane protein